MIAVESFEAGICKATMGESNILPRTILVFASDIDLSHNFASLPVTNGAFRTCTTGFHFPRLDRLNKIDIKMVQV